MREQEMEVDRLTHELQSTRGFLRGTQIALQESESRSEELLEEIRQRSTTSILVESQISFDYRARGCWWSRRGAPVDGGA
jgi:hypothetical protein